LDQSGCIFTEEGKSTSYYFLLRSDLSPIETVETLPGLAYQVTLTGSSVHRGQLLVRPAIAHILLGEEEEITKRLFRVLELIDTPLAS
jgi:hypothetical protein